LLIVLLVIHARRGPQVVWDTEDKGTDHPLGYLGPFLAAALMASYVMYGFDTAGSLAEETRAPRRRAPRAILQALAAAAGAGALLMLGALMAAGDFHKLGQASGGLPYTVKEVLGENVGTLFLCDVIFAIIVCALAVHTATVRLMFAMARDNNLPLGSILAHVSPASRTPVVPVVVAGLLAAVLLILNACLSGLVDLIAPVAIVWANLAYLSVTGPMLYRRLKGWLPAGNAAAGSLFTLGRWGLIVNMIAVAWGVLMIANMACHVPRYTARCGTSNMARCCLQQPSWPSALPIMGCSSVIAPASWRNIVPIPLVLSREGVENNEWPLWWVSNTRPT
jgi:amino acid transporter